MIDVNGGKGGKKRLPTYTFASIQNDIVIIQIENYCLITLNTSELLSEVLTCTKYKPVSFGS